MIGVDKLRELLGTEEGQYHDFKSLLDGPRGSARARDRRRVRDQIAEYVAAFANAEGGVLIMGAEDDGSLTGHRYPPDAVDLMLSTPENRLVPPQPRGARVMVDEVELLVFEVEVSPTAVQVQDGGFPYRIGDTTKQWSEEKINRVKASGLVESGEARRSVASLNDLDNDVIDRAIQGAGLGGLDRVEYLMRRRLADRRGANAVLREAATLLFAREAQVIGHPNAGVRVFRVDGKERLTGVRHNVQEFPRIEGNLPGVLGQVRALLGTLIQHSARLRDLFFEEMPEYPTFAWQEALVNAVAHRDYAITGQSVEVWLYEDRMEVLSPGGLVPEVSLDDLRLGHPTHGSRNPRIARVLAEIGIMRDQGEGIPRMLEEMQMSFLPVPVFDVISGRFRVVLSNQPLPGVGDPDLVQAVRALPISIQQKRALVAFAQREFANNDYCALNAVERDTAYRELTDLVRLGYLAGSGDGAGTRYRLQRAAVPVKGEMSAQARLAARMDAAGFVTNTDYREAFGVDRKTARLALTAWSRQGIVIREGERRGTRYRPGPDWTRANVK